MHFLQTPREPVTACGENIYGHNAYTYDIANVTCQTCLLVVTAAEANGFGYLSIARFFLRVKEMDDGKLEALLIDMMETLSRVALKFPESLTEGAQGLAINIEVVKREAAERRMVWSDWAKHQLRFVGGHHVPSEIRNAE